MAKQKVEQMKGGEPQEVPAIRVRVRRDHNKRMLKDHKKREATRDRAWRASLLKRFEEVSRCEP